MASAVPSSRSNTGAGKLAVRDASRARAAASSDSGGFALAALAANVQTNPQTKL